LLSQQLQEVNMRPEMENSRRSKWITIGLMGTVFLWLWLLYGRSLYQATPQLLRPLWGLTGPLALTTDFLNPLFHSPLLFIASYLVGAGLIVSGVLKFFQAGIWRRTLLSAGLLALLFPLLMPFAYGRYQKPVEAGEGYQLHWVTEPANLYSGAYKQAQLRHEGECDYRLAGWISDTMLAYTSACWPGAWRYEVTSGEKVWSLGASGEIAPAAAAVRRGNGRLYLQEPDSLRQGGEYPFLTLERAASPGGQWEAIVVRWFYGPSDIVIVGRATLPAAQHPGHHLCQLLLADRFEQPAGQALRLQALQLILHRMAA
jgi:hypothetical protein